MVYCGKPSRACAECKERKVKCDLKDNCRPCRRANLKCSGLRDPKELVFRDESRAVVQKALASRAFKGLPKSITFSIEDRARGFFFSHYVLGNTRTFDYLQSFTPETDSHLYNSIAAVSLAHFSRKANSAEILGKARLKYISALRLVNETLQNGDLATQDATFLSVLLLDLFEKITRTTPISYELWTKHMKGALALTKLRGHEQFSNLVGLRMFLQLTSNVLISCLQRDVPVPDDLLALQIESRNYLDVTQPKVRFSQAIIRFIKLRVVMKEHSLPANDVVWIAKDLDTDFESISITMPSTFQYSAITYPSPSNEVYEDYFHIYPHSRVTHIWNLLRIVRILLNEIIMNQCLEAINYTGSRNLVHEYTSEIQRSSSIIALLSAEICATVPQYTLLPRLYREPPTSESSIDPTYSPWSRDTPDIFDTMGACPEVLELPASSKLRHTPQSELHTPFNSARIYSLIFPLYIAGQSVASPEHLRRWVFNRLYSISTDIGIREAHLVAGFLERREDINPWSVYAMIGSYSFSA